jgi:hypothetical protein
MLLLASYDIVFQEVPGEVTLALNLSLCPNHCPECHSPHLRGQVGEPLDDILLGGLLARYGDAVTCVAFMGGDADTAEVDRLAAAVHAWKQTEFVEVDSLSAAVDARECAEGAEGTESTEGANSAETPSHAADKAKATGYEVDSNAAAEDKSVGAWALANQPLKTAWYSGRGDLPAAIRLENVDFIKLGPYDPARGGLSSPTTNQRFYRVETAPGSTRKMVDATALFYEKAPFGS